ncbi:MAG: ribbon-helix-helix domain-containing protein [Cyanobacteria bacterium P01_B01_bin.77]
MSNKVSITARIPEEMLEQVELHAQVAGKTKTDILTDALAKYLGDVSGTNTDAISNLEQQIQHLNQYLLLRLTALEAKVAALEQNEQPSHGTQHQIEPTKRVTQPRLLPGSQIV